MSLFGGEGPMFFMYEQTTNCSKLWFWHLTFLNNIVPWGEKDTCMPWTWYIANEMQFYLTIPLFVPQQEMQGFWNMALYNKQSSTHLCK